MSRSIELGVVDYGAGNVTSVVFAFERLGVNVKRIGNADELSRCDRVVLPGVGAAQDAMARIRSSGFEEALHDVVLKRCRPFLGICLGMQVLATELTEHGLTKGLNFIPGRVKHMSEISKQGIKLPHMGWAPVKFVEASPLSVGRSKEEAAFYFAHSYIFDVLHEKFVASRTNFSHQFVSAVHRENIFATQFHPEKSQLAGSELLEKFLDWNP